MTYVLSDIHGDMKRFEDILGQIELGEQDTLYILGDVIDRNPDGIDILRRIMDMPNVKMLLGNHEYMMMRALGFPYDGPADIENEDKSDLKELWYENGGGITHLGWCIARQPVRRKIIAYLKSLPLNFDVEVNGKTFKLVHAAPAELYDEYSGTFYKSRTEFAVWDRKFLLKSKPVDTTIIFGHTPTIMLEGGGNSNIWKRDNLIGIDCGCAFANENTKYGGKLGCLRLEDMKEFYAFAAK